MRSKIVGLGRRRWGSLEHRVWSQFKLHKLTDVNCFALAVSGGLDSMVLLDVLTKLKPKAQFLVLHYHHGLGRNEIQNQYRNECLDLVRETCQKLIDCKINLEFKHEVSQEELFSENDFRKARLCFIKTEIKNFVLKRPDQQIYFATGHHYNDLLETRLLKLIRGCGADSLKRFRFVNQQVVRPLLFETKDRLLSHAQHNNLSWCDDPSNVDNRFLRNWIRNIWLKQLEKKRPGSVMNLSESLSRAIDVVDNNDQVIEINYGPVIEHSGARNLNEYRLKVYWLDRALYLKLHPAAQMTALARLLAKLKVDFTEGQIKEVRKRLDKNQKELTFTVACVNWVINAERIMVQLKV